MGVPFLHNRIMKNIVANLLVHNLIELDIFIYLVHNIFHKACIANI